VSRVAGDGDDVVEDDVVGEQVEEVPAVGQAGEPFLDDPKDGSSALKSSRLSIVVTLSSLCFQVCAVRRCRSRRS